MTLGILVVAFAFGIGTLWVTALWPFAVFQVVIMLTACVWFGSTAWCGQIRAGIWLLFPFAIAGGAALQFALGRSEDLWQTRQSVFDWATYACAAFLAFQVASDDRLRWAALRIFAMSAGALALISTVQNYTVPGRVLWMFDSGYADSVFGPFTYHTKLANFAELAIAASMWLALREKRGRAIYVANAAALAGAVVASASRGGLAVLAIEVLTLGIVAAGKNVRENRSVILALSCAVVMGAAICGWGLLANRFANEDPMRDLRLPVDLSSLQMAGKYWAAGSGLGSWSTVYPEFARFDAHLFMNQAHCDWLQWTVEGGIALPACMLAMLAVSVAAARREWWTLGIIFVWLHGLIDYPMQQTPAFASLQLAFWGAGVALMRRASAEGAGSGGIRTVASPYRNQRVSCA